MKEKVPKKLNSNLMIKQYQKVYILETGHVINQTGKIILDIIDGRKTISELIEKIARTYPNINKEKIGKEINDFLSRLEEEHIIQLK